MKLDAMLWIIFALGTLGLVWFSWWASLKDKRWHGITRFFAFWAIFALGLLNYPVWFKDPFCLRQIVSWILLFGSIVPAAHGYHMLRTAGRAQGRFENTTALIEKGAYKYVRHPMYLSLIMLAAGAFLKAPSPLGGALLAVNVISLFATARIEESEMIARFGTQYADYMKRTKRFIPFLF